MLVGQILGDATTAQFIWHPSSSDGSYIDTVAYYADILPAPARDGAWCYHKIKGLLKTLLQTVHYHSFFCGFFNNAVIISGCIASNDRMTVKQ
jgi:hypothetical protein